MAVSKTGNSRLSMTYVSPGEGDLSRAFVRETISNEKLKEKLMELLSGKFYPGAYMWMLRKDIIGDNQNLAVPDQKIYACLYALEKEDKIKHVKMPRGKGNWFTLKNAVKETVWVGV